MAKYDLSKPMRKAQFERRVKALIKNSKFVELKELTDRSLSQNNYLHLCLSYYAIEFGYSIDYVKRHIFKILVNPIIFIVERINEKSGDMYRDLRSSSDLTKEEMTLAIFRFSDHSAQGGLRLPEPSDLVYLREIMESVEMHKQYL